MWMIRRSAIAEKSHCGWYERYDPAVQAAVGGRDGCGLAWNREGRPETPRDAEQPGSHSLTSATAPPRLLLGRGPRPLRGVTQFSVCTLTRNSIIGRTGRDNVTVLELVVRLPSCVRSGRYVIRSLCAAHSV